MVEKEHRNVESKLTWTETKNTDQKEKQTINTKLSPQTNLKGNKMWKTREGNHEEIII